MHLIVEFAYHLHYIKRNDTIFNNFMKIANYIRRSVKVNITYESFKITFNLRNCRRIAISQNLVKQTQTLRNVKRVLTVDLLSVLLSLLSM